MKISCVNCGNIAELVNGVCSKCEVKAAYVVIEKDKETKEEKEARVKKEKEAKEKKDKDKAKKDKK